MKTNPAFSRFAFLTGALLVTVAALSVMGAVGWGLTGILQ